MVGRILVFFLCTSFYSLAQLSSTGEGLILDLTYENSNCWIVHPSFYSNCVVTYGETFDSTLNIMNNDGIHLESVDSLRSDASPIWFALPAISGSGAEAVCTSFDSIPAFLNMKDNPQITVIASSNRKGDTLRLHLSGGARSLVNENSFGYDGQSGKAVELVFSRENEFEHFAMSFESFTIEDWKSWLYSDSIQYYGFSTNDTTAVFNIREIYLGDYCPEVWLSRTSGHGLCSNSHQVENSPFQVRQIQSSSGLELIIESNSPVFGILNVYDLQGRLIAKFEGVPSNQRQIIEQALPNLVVVRFHSENDVISQLLLTK